MAVGPAVSMLGLSRRGIGLSVGLLLLLTSLVVVRATVRERPDPASSPASTAVASEPPGPREAPAPAPAEPATTVMSPVVGRFGPQDLPRFGPEPAPSRRAGRVGRRAATAADRRKMMEEGWQLYRAQRFEDARTVFARLAGKPGAPAGVYLGLGKVAFQKQDYAEAATRAREAAKRGEGLDAQMLLGDAHYRMQQYREAQKAYRDALKSDPKHEPAQRALKLVERQLQ